MLNISYNSIDRDRVLKDQSAYRHVIDTSASVKIIYLLAALGVFTLIIMFLPWTQNIRSRGLLTTLQPENREQDIHSLITGRIEKWYVKEGELVEKGDTIVFISEMVAEYLDPSLIDRARNQTEAKKASTEAYLDKTVALDQQIQALRQNQVLKLEQARNYLRQTQLKVTSDSIDYHTARLNLEIAENQYQRQNELYQQGLKSLTELQQRKQQLQESLNKRVSAENKWLASKNELINAKIQLNTVSNEFQEKIAKATSDRMSARSQAMEAEGEYQKLSSQLANYQRRSGFYYITAPQEGYVTRAKVHGIGETVKEGEAVFTLVPVNFELAVEMYVRPIDLPLIRKGNRVRLQFDGWPALVFDGWPNLSFGTYAGQIVAYDNAAGPDGNFRVLVAADPQEEPWPELLKLGSGVYGIALLKNVPVWYELWRNLNGFPPDFYWDENKNQTVEEKK